MLAISNMDAQVTLYMADGTPYPLPTVHITASGVAAVAVNDALAAAPPSVASHISAWGSASVSYSYDWQGAILATMSLLDLGRSLQYVYPFMFPHDPSNAAMSGAMTLEGLWWKTTPTPHIFVALTNTASQTRNATVTLLDATGASLSTQPVSIPPQGTSLARVDFPPDGTLGGLRVQYSGGMDDLLAGAGIEDATAGYSANLPIAMTGMPDALGPRQLQIASVGIMNGPADPMMGFPKGVVFTPYIYLRNVSSSPRLVQSSFNWMNGSSPQTANLPATTLQPGESRQLTQPPLPGTPPEILNFTYSFNGLPEDILPATGSVDSSANYVFGVEPEGVAQSAGVTSLYWNYGNGLDTMYALWNPLSVAQQGQLILIGDNGYTLYTIPIRLAPRASTTIDLYELFSTGRPDATGRTMPRGPMQGTARLTGPKNDTTDRFTIALSGAIYSAKSATCVWTCNTCSGLSSFSTSPSPANVVAPGTLQMAASYTWDDGYQYDDTKGVTWSSSNPSVATIQTGGADPGLLTGVAGGTFTVGAAFGGWPVYIEENCGNPPATCSRYWSPDPQIPGTDCPTSVSIAATTGLPLINDFPALKTGIGRLTQMLLGPGPTNWNNSPVYESLSQTSSTCGSYLTGQCTGMPGPFTVGPASGGNYLGTEYPAIGNSEFNDVHTTTSAANALSGGPQSCQVICSQRYTCGGKTIGTFTITRTFSQTTINGTAVTNVDVTKQ